jgi:predicted signal transduction protein with EAL and GGDEF domain
MSRPRNSRCSVSRRWAYGSRSTISAPAIRACYLRRFPFDKLDRPQLVHSIERASDAAAIVHAVVSLGRGLGMKVTAEGVETAEQHLFLRAAGIHFMQGYRVGRPSPVAEISKRLNEPGSFKLSDEIPGMKKTG